jgi:hypothetical protein
VRGHRSSDQGEQATDEMKMASPPKAVPANRRQRHGMAGAGKQQPSRCFMCAARLLASFCLRSDRRDGPARLIVILHAVSTEISSSHACGSSQSAKPGKDRSCKAS